jgi:hypothetical protein
LSSVTAAGPPRISTGFPVRRPLPRKRPTTSARRNKPEFSKSERGCKGGVPGGIEIYSFRTAYAAAVSMTVLPGSGTAAATRTENLSPKSRGSRNYDRAKARKTLWFSYLRTSVAKSLTGNGTLSSLGHANWKIKIALTNFREPTMFYSRVMQCTIERASSIACSPFDRGLASLRSSDRDHFAARLAHLNRDGPKHARQSQDDRKRADLRELSGSGVVLIRQFV